MSLATGTRLGSYAIRAPLGRGGAGEVYRAWDPRLEREVALKILHQRTELNPDRVWRFVAEARAASALNHPNILTVFDAAVDGATPYIVSELIDGDSLRGELRRGAVPVKRLLDLATQIADGLAEAHSAGIVHRDLKPENIMVTPAGRAKILDFGLARTDTFDTGVGLPALLDEQTQTESGLLVGTIPYMSPEQARGGTTDFRTDQFSFGLVLYEMAAGRPAFRRETPAETLEAILSEEPTPLPDVNPAVPLMLWWVVERCLAKNPGDRYGVTSDLHRDLRTLRDRYADLLSRERRAATADARPRALRPLLLVTAALASFAAGAILWSLLTAPPLPRGELPPFTPLATEGSYEGLPAWSPDGQTIAYAAEVRGTLHIFARSLSSSTPAQLTDAPFDCKFPFWSRDSKRIYYVSLARTRDGIWSVGAAGGTPEVVVENAIRGAMSPDGRTIAFLRHEKEGEILGTASVYLATPGVPEPWPREAVAASETRYMGLDPLRFVEGTMAFSPDGRALGLIAVPVVNFPFGVNEDSRGWRFWILPLQPGAKPVRKLAYWDDVIPQVTSLSWLPDNRHVVFGAAAMSSPGSELWIADVEADTVRPLTRSADSESYPSVSPDGTRVVFTRGEPDYDLVEISTADGSVQPLLATARKETDPVWSPDGTLLAYVTDRSGRDEIWVRNRSAPPFDRPLITQDDFVDGENVLFASLAFSPDGQRIAYLRTGGGPIRPMLLPLQIFASALPKSPPVRLLPSSRQSYQSGPTWSPDGQWVAFSEWAGERWELVKLRMGVSDAAVLRRDGVPNAAPQWSPKDDWITWETQNGFVLVSPDGQRQRPLDIDQWLVHAWSRDASSVMGIVETEDRRLAVVSVDVRSGRSRTIADLGPSPPVNNPVQGFSPSPGGQSVVTGIVRPRGDLWLLDGIRPPERSWSGGFVQALRDRVGGTASP